MIAAIGLGALRRRRCCSLLRAAAGRAPRPAPLVELARFDAAHAPRAVHGAGALGRTGPVADLGAAGRGRGVGGRATDPPRRHLHQPAAGPRVDRPHLRAGDDPQGAVRRRRAAASRCCCWSWCRPRSVPPCRPGRRWWWRCCWPRRCSSCPTWKPGRRPTRRRAEFRHALGAYLDLVALEMAARAAPAEALPAAAKIGTGWPLALIRDTLYRATRAGRDPWAALGDLGQRIGVTELRDLGQLIALVAHDGARVRSTLTARAQTMRRHELAEPAGPGRQGRPEHADGAGPDRPGLPAVHRLPRRWSPSSTSNHTRPTPDGATPVPHHRPERGNDI